MGTAGIQNTIHGETPMRNSLFVAVVVALTTLLWPHDVQANYIDPTTGGVLLQVIFLSATI